jgi:hypothetical protein
VYINKKIVTVVHPFEVKKHLNFIKQLFINALSIIIFPEKDEKSFKLFILPKIYVQILKLDEHGKKLTHDVTENGNSNEKEKSAYKPLNVTHWIKVSEASC